VLCTGSGGGRRLIMEAATSSGLAGRFCLVTGANGGLGKATARELAKGGAVVVMACRDRARGYAARYELATETGNEALDLMIVDLSSQQSVRDMAAEFKRKHNRLDVLVNNAAIFKGSRTTSPDGLELMFATNHLGPFLLTTMLLDELKAAGGARIITLTAPSTVKPDFDDLQGERKFRATQSFGASKTCNLLFTYELARRLAGTGATANAFHPGLMRSGLMNEAPAPVRWMLYLASSPPERAARDLAYLASSPEVEGVTGSFFKGRNKIKSSDYSYDKAAQRRLWEESARLAHLQ
jgi:NAD(P)-dependent dehydrogenase (short-subunit alcohol dehydrogenase family)